MAIPVSPVVEGLEPYEVVFGADQPEYRPLPALVGPGPERRVMSRWQLTDEERQLVADGGGVYLSLWTYGQIPPSAIQIMRSAGCADAVRAGMQLDKELSERAGILGAFIEKQLSEAKND